MVAETFIPPALVLQNITKRFDNFTVLDGVTASFLSGRIHGVLGENGAGKSTLMRIAAGLIRADAGEIHAQGNVRERWTAGDASAAGVAMVHQHFMLVPTLTVAENCALGRRSLGQWSARRRATELVERIGESTGLRVQASARVDTLSVGQRQRVEIIRALSIAQHVLILDEPTAVLTPREVDELFDALLKLKDQGMAIAFISHKLGEVARICDDLTILRRGRCVYSGPADDLSTEQMARHMVGSAPATLPSKPASEVREVVLVCHEVSAHHEDNARAIHQIKLEVCSGQIVGVAGVEGNGQDVLAEAIVGIRRLDRGRITLAGEDITQQSVSDRQALGLAHVPEDRLSQGLIPGMDLVENAMLRIYRTPRVARSGFIHWKSAGQIAADWIQRFDVRAESIHDPIERLSGGNQQKLLLARELAGSPRLILAHNPVRGLDIAATRFVFSELIEQAKRGGGILLIHSDLDELLAIADRVLVMFEGRLIETNWPRCDRATIGQLMLGGRA